MIRKIALLATTAALFVACGGNTEEKKAEEMKTEGEAKMEEAAKTIENAVDTATKAMENAVDSVQKAVE